MNELLLRIDQLCAEKNISKKELAINAGIPYAAIANLFGNDVRPTIPTLEKICMGLGITMAQFFSDAAEPLKPTTKERRMLELWRHIPPEKREMAIAWLKKLAEKK